MILTITPNPALDVTGEVETIVPNEKTYVVGEQRHPGGNGINAARVVAALEVPVVATGFIAGNTGTEIETLLEQEGVRHDFVRMSGQTRVNVTVTSRTTSKQTRLSFPGPVVPGGAVSELVAKIRAQRELSIANIGGSFPPGFGEREFHAIMEALSEKECAPIIDVPNRQMDLALAARPLLIKPNLHEFQGLIGKDVTTASEVARAAMPLLAKVAIVCVSSVEGGAVLAASSGVWFAYGPRVVVRSSVGAGDAMIGGMMVELHRAGVNQWSRARRLSDDVARAMLTTGLAASMATIERPGTDIGDKSAIEAHRAAIKVQALAEHEAVRSAGSF